MKVILLQDVEDLGKKFDVKEVKNGYARNFLIPQGLAKLATKESMKSIDELKKIEAEKAEENLKEYQEMASRLDGLEIIIPVKVGEEGQLFESINAQKISEKLKEMGFDIKKSQIDLKDPIKALGDYQVKLSLDHNLEAEVTVMVTEEKI